MTLEEQDLLLKDLCSRLPHGVVIQEKCVEHDKTFLPNKEVDRLVNIDAHANSLMTNGGSSYYIDEIKPYLFPLSSMTEEQQEEYDYECNKDLKALLHSVANRTYAKTRIATPLYYGIDWLNKNHFDYRGLIPMRLAIDATGLNIY